MPTNLIVAVLLGPLAAAYDFVTNPAAPPQIFIEQFNASFPNHQIPPTRPVRKHITVTRT